MGWKKKIKLKKPKIKVKAPSGITNAIKSASQIPTAALKGDFKGMAQGAQGLTSAAKELGKDFAKQSMAPSLSALKGLGSLAGSEDIKGLASNIQRESNKGIDTYGDTAMDIGANVATGGAYGAAQQALGAVAGGGLGSLVDPQTLKQAAMSYGASQLGVDPNMLKTAQAGLSGDLKGAALQAAGSYGGFDPNMIKGATSALRGDLSGAAMGAAGIDPKYANMAKSALSGDMSGVAEQAAQSAGVDPSAISAAKSFSQGGTQGLVNAATSQVKGAVQQMVPQQAKAALEQGKSAISQANQFKNTYNQLTQKPQQMDGGAFGEPAGQPMQEAPVDQTQQQPLDLTSQAPTVQQAQPLSITASVPDQVKQYPLGNALQKLRERRKAKRGFTTPAAQAGSAIKKRFRKRLG